MTAKSLEGYIADGFRDDCMTLLSKFAGTNSARFSDFVKVWQEMKFSTVFCGLNTFSELLEFTEDALCISKRLFLPPNPDISRIGALYLLYGVYTQQPTRGLVKIRMTPNDWTHTINFIDNVREFGYADANFIFHSLCYSGAFTFTVSNKEYGLERSYRRQQINSTNVQEITYLTTNQLLKPAFEDIDIEELEKMRESYENCKNIIQRQEEKAGMEFTSVTPREGILTALRKVIDPFITRQAYPGSSKTSAGILNESNSDIAGSSNSISIGEGRKELKKRAYKRQTLGQNHLKSCLSTTEDVESQVEAPGTSRESLAESLQAESPQVESSQAKSSQAKSSQAESSQAEITESQEKSPMKKNMFTSAKKRKNVTKPLPPHGESLSPATSLVGNNVDLSESSKSVPTSETNSTSEIPVRRSKRIRKVPESMRS